MFRGVRLRGATPIIMELVNRPPNGALVAGGSVADASGAMIVGTSKEGFCNSVDGCWVVGTVGEGCTNGESSFALTSVTVAGGVPFECLIAGTDAAPLNAGAT